MRSVLFLLSGSASKIASAHNLDLSETEIVKLDEKELSKPFKMISLIKNYSGHDIYFGTIENRFQRFQIFIKIFLFLTLSFNGIIIDELGNKNKFNLGKFIILEFPLLIIEIIYSSILVVYYHIKLYWLKWKYTKN